MGIPELYHDETIILQAHNIKVKSVVFDAVLTNNRLILIDSKKGLIPPQEILLPAISTVDGGENAIRDPILTFTIIAKGGTARQMILTFPREACGERRRERDDWLKELKERIGSLEHATIVAETIEPEPVYHSEITPPSYSEVSGLSSQKKKIDIVRPKRSIIDSVPTMPRPVETTSLPVGSFCSRCGNRVPPESVFCNRCGTPVASSAEPAATIPPATPPTLQAPIPSAVPQVQIPTPHVFGLGGERKERTLEEVIHSIEPLIEDSVPRRSEPAPLVPRQYPAPPPFIETPAAVETPAEVPAAEPAAPVAPGEPAPVTAETAGIPPSIPATPPLPQVMPPRPSGKRKYVAIAMVAIVILIAIVGIVVLPNFAGTTPDATVTSPTNTTTPTVITTVPTTVPTPTPVVTTPVVTLTPTPKPQAAIPPNGVWLRVMYPGKFDGTYGTPGGQTPVGERNTGDQFFMVSTIDGPVVASIQKLDGSSNELVITVYKNGIAMDHKSTTAPKGTIDFQADLRSAVVPTTAVPQTPVPTITSVETTPAANPTVNST